MHPLVFTLVPVFVIAVGSGRGDGAANFAELDSDFSEPGKHVLNIRYDRCFACLRESCAWHMSVGKYLVACKATNRMFQTCDDL